MMNSKTSITTFQLIFILIHMQIGVGILSMPHDLFKASGTDSWITILVTGIITQLFIFLFGALMKRFPNNNIFGIARLLLGKKLGNVLTIMFSIFYIFFAVITLARFAYILRAWMLPHTPSWVILAIMCFTTVFIVKENIQVIARFTIIASVVFTSFIVVSIFVLDNATFSHLFPVGTNGFSPIIKGVPKTLYSYFGYELIVFLYPFVQPPNKGIVRSATIANIFVTLFYFLLVVITLISFTAKELLQIPEPVLFLVKSISFEIIERPDLLFTSMWIVLSATTIFIIIYISSLGLATVMRTTNLIYAAIIVTFVSFLGTLPVDDMFIMDALSKLGDRFIRPVILGVPIIFLIISIICNKKEEVEDT